MGDGQSLGQTLTTINRKGTAKMAQLNAGRGNRDLGQNPSISTEGIKINKWLASVAALVAIVPTAYFGAERVRHNGPVDGGGVLAGLIPGTNLRTSKGVLPSTYKGPELNSQRAQARARDLYDANTFFNKAGVSTPWLDSVPMNHAHYKNGFLDTLKDGNRTLSTTEVEFAREAVLMFAYHDQRTDLGNMQRKFASVPKDKWGEIAAKDIYETSMDALAYVGVSNPSKELVQYSFGVAANGFVNRNGRYSAQAGQIYKGQKRWPTLSELLEKPHGDCTAFSILAVELTKAGEKVIPELKGMKAVNGSVFRYEADRPNKGAPHSVYTFQINDSFIFMSDHGTAALGSNFTYPNNPLFLSVNAPLSLGEIATLSTRFVAPSNNTKAKYFNLEHVGGDRPGEMLNLGNADWHLDAGNWRNMSKELRDQVLQGGLRQYTRFDKWASANKNVLPTLTEIVDSYYR
jgi:hypothetical protein